MKNLGALAVVLLGTVISIAIHMVLYGYFVVETCGVSDVANRFPANASSQGWMCGAYAEDLWRVPGFWGLVFSTILAVGAAGWIWSRGGAWPWLSPFGLVVVPALALLLLSLPADSCTRDQRAEHGEVQCRTTPVG